jgi:hypothetical protein
MLRCAAIAPRYVAKAAAGAPAATAAAVLKNDRRSNLDGARAEAVAASVAKRATCAGGRGGYEARQHLERWCFEPDTANQPALFATNDAEIEDTLGGPWIGTAMTAPRK